MSLRLHQFLCALVMTTLLARFPVLAAGATIRYTVPKDAFVTLNVFRPDGWVVRELLVDQKQPAGAHEVVWDGRDNTGRLLPAGDYQARMLTHAGITWTYVSSIGNGGTPAWPTADGSGGWGGNHGNPTSVGVDADGVYLGWTSTEGPFAVMRRSLNGARGKWGTTMGPYEGVHVLATDGQALFGANTRALLKIDRDTGRQLLRQAIQAERPADAQGELVDPPGSISYQFSRPDEKGRVWGLAAGGGRIYLSLPWVNTIKVFESAKLQPVPTEDIALPRPRGLCLDGQGNLLAVSQGKVFRIDLKTRISQVLIGHDLAAPFAIARTATGVLYVTEMAPRHQVKKFAADGALVATFGRNGGGSDFDNNLGGGEFQAADFREPCALAATADGGFWVVEDMIPKRMARFSADGKVLYQGFGSTNYAAHTAPNPNAPAELFTTMWGLLSGRIDYATPGTWTMGRILRARFGAAGAGVLTEYGWDTAPHRVFARNGLTYLWSGQALFIGYALQTHIPWATLLPAGMKLADLRGKRFKLDAGVTWALPLAGGKPDPKSVRAYWQGKDPAMQASPAADWATAARLTPAGWGWATLADGQPAPSTAEITATRVAQPMSLEGKAEDWDAIKAVEIPGPLGPTGSCKVAYDDQRLYAMVRVMDASPMRNGAATPELLFKGGDMVAFTFGTVNGQGVNQKLAFGVMRSGDPPRMLYRPVSAVKQPYTFKSPVGEVTFDYVGCAREAQVKYQQFPDGYLARMAIPWTLLGYTPAAGMHIPFDIQLNFSDMAGSQNAYVAWWHSRNAESAANYDIPTEAKLYPREWGQLVLK
jgi:hypothetical protein